MPPPKIILLTFTQFKAPVLKHHQCRNAAEMDSGSTNIFFKYFNQLSLNHHVNHCLCFFKRIPMVTMLLINELDFYFGSTEKLNCGLTFFVPFFSPWILIWIHIITYRFQRLIWFLLQTTSYIQHSHNMKLHSTNLDQRTYCFQWLIWFPFQTLS